ncbi:MarR family winged helix-turn-helix transcriptional regulator [Amycolatopsis taiwanensis]|uniref:MarR family transcriptional regulator n=1 Tax=Amycolatopsis taiwanensis TaxID=342230 RepID=A0A9W6VF26_9PSEU|nr:MarR family transcriptional regulator [Amycolatopsis taiwanensis]GLY65062.1 MarR family transcriptional regulator [Amycolatopsis taiwanensis]
MAEDPDVDELSAMLYTGISLLVRRLRQVAEQGEPSLPERAALSRLDRHGPATAAELARAEQITPQSMGTTLAGLQARGLVERRADPADGRRIIMSLTKAGQRVLRQKRDARAQRISNALTERFSPAEIKKLRAAAPLIERLGEVV